MRTGSLAKLWALVIHLGPWGQLLQLVQVSARATQGHPPSYPGPPTIASCSSATVSHSSSLSGFYSPQRLQPSFIPFSSVSPPALYPLLTHSSSFILPLLHHSSPSHHSVPPPYIFYPPNAWITSTYSVRVKLSAIQHTHLLTEDLIGPSSSPFLLCIFYINCSSSSSSFSSAAHHTHLFHYHDTTVSLQRLPPTPPLSSLSL